MKKLIVAVSLFAVTMVSVAAAPVPPTYRYGRVPTRQSTARICRPVARDCKYIGGKLVCNPKYPRSRPILTCR